MSHISEGGPWLRLDFRVRYPWPDLSLRYSQTGWIQNDIVRTTIPGWLIGDTSKGREKGSVYHRDRYDTKDSNLLPGVLHFDRKGGRNYTKKNNKIILVHDTGECTRIIEGTSIKTCTKIKKFIYKDVYLQTTSLYKLVKHGKDNTCTYRSMSLNSIKVVVGLGKIAIEGERVQKLMTKIKRYT